MKDFSNTQSNYKIKLDAKTIILYNVNKIQKVQQVVSLMILLGKFHLHKAEFLRSQPSFQPFRLEFKNYFECIQRKNDKKCADTANVLKDF